MIVRERSGVGMEHSIRIVVNYVALRSVKCTTSYGKRLESAMQMSC